MPALRPRGAAAPLGQGRLCSAGLCLTTDAALPRHGGHWCHLKSADGEWQSQFTNTFTATSRLVREQTAEPRGLAELTLRLSVTALRCVDSAIRGRKCFPAQGGLRLANAVTTWHIASVPSRRGGRRPAAHHTRPRRPPTPPRTQLRTRPACWPSTLGFFAFHLFVSVS